MSGGLGTGVGFRVGCQNGDVRGVACVDGICLCVHNTEQVGGVDMGGTCVQVCP